MNADGSGQLSVGLEVDAAAERAFVEVTGRGFSESYALSDVVTAGWEVRRTALEGGGSAVLASRRFDSPAEAVDALTTVAGEPPVVFSRMQLERNDRLVSVGFDFALSVDLSSSLISDTLAASIGSEAISKLVTRYSIEIPDDISAGVRVRLPGEVRMHNAAEIDRGDLVWHVKGGETIRLEAKSNYVETPYMAASAAGALALLALVVLLISDARRRRMRRRGGVDAGGPSSKRSDSAGGALPEA